MNSRANFVSGLQAETRTDPLTGLANRRCLYERIEIEMAHALRSDTPLSVAMIDLDHFKQYNDSYGHVAGDTLLRGIAALMVSNVRGQDLVSRYGGEEFCLVMPDTDLVGGHHLLDKLRAGGREADLGVRRDALGRPDQLGRHRDHHVLHRAGRPGALPGQGGGTEPGGVHPGIHRVLTGRSTVARYPVPDGADRPVGRSLAPAQHQIDVVVHGERIHQAEPLGGGGIELRFQLEPAIGDHQAPPVDPEDPVRGAHRTAPVGRCRRAR